MRLVGWPTYFSEEEGILPVDLQDIDIHATPEELRTLAKFFEEAADEVSKAILGRQSLNVEIDFGDSKPNAQTGIHVNVVHNAA